MASIVVQSIGTNAVAFDDRHSEWLILMALVGVTAAVSLPALQTVGYEGWRLLLGVIACIATIFLLLIGHDIIAWVKEKIHRQ